MAVMAGRMMNEAPELMVVRRLEQPESCEEGGKQTWAMEVELYSVAPRLKFYSLYGRGGVV